jgi:hypothetical protein
MHHRQKRSKSFPAPRIAAGELCKKRTRNLAMIPAAMSGTLEVQVIFPTRRLRVGDTMTAEGQGDLFKSNCKEGNRK